MSDPQGEGGSETRQTQRVTSPRKAKQLHFFKALDYWYRRHPGNNLLVSLTIDSCNSGAQSSGLTGSHTPDVAAAPSRPLRSRGLRRRGSCLPLNSRKRK